MRKLMHLYCFLVVVFMLVPTNVYSQRKKDYKVLNDTSYTIMKYKKFDIERFDKNKNDLDYYEFTKEDGTKINESTRVKGYSQYLMPSRKLYTITSIFNLDGSLDRRYITLGGLLIDVFYEFDEAGNQTRAEDMEVDLPKKFDYNQLMLLMHKKKWIDIETGEDRDNFLLSYLKDKNCWRVIISSIHSNTKLRDMLYIIDANSGRIKKRMKLTIN